MIRIECRGADTLPLDAIEEFQGNLKKRTKREIDQIIKSIRYAKWCADNGRVAAITRNGEPA